MARWFRTTEYFNNINAKINLLICFYTKPQDLKKICCWICFQASRDNHPISRAVSSNFLVFRDVWQIFIHNFHDTTHLEWECTELCSGTVIYRTISSSAVVINKQLCQTGVWVLFVYLACLYFYFSKHVHFVPVFERLTHNHCDYRTSPTLYYIDQFTLHRQTATDALSGFVGSVSYPCWHLLPSVGACFLWLNVELPVVRSRNV